MSEKMLVTRALDERATYEEVFATYNMLGTDYRQAEVEKQTEKKVVTQKMFKVV